MRTKTANAKALYISGAHAIDPALKLNRAVDILAINGKITAIGKVGELKTKAKNAGAETVNGKGLFLSPGFIDLNCTINEPGAEQIESFATGSAAAAAGGFTSILVKPICEPVNDNAHMTDFVLRRAQENSSVRVIPMGALTGAREGKKLAEIGSMAAAGVRAVGDGVCVSDTYLMRKALEYVKAFGLPVFSFPEDKSLTGQGVMHEGLNSNRLGLRGIPSAAEEIIVSRDIVLTRHTKGKLHFQPLSTKGSLELVRIAKKEGLPITAETCPVYFTLNSNSIATYDANYKCFPPLRSPHHLEAVIEALRDGTIDVISSGHLPQSRSSKEQSFEHATPGMIGLESTFSLVLELVRKKKITPSRLVELLSSGPAKILGLYGELGTLKVGAKADMVLFDPEKKFIFDESRIFSASKNSPFLGTKMQGMVAKTFVGGTEVYSYDKRKKA